MQPEIVRALFIANKGKWFGPPALVRRPLESISDRDVLDGRMRLRVRRELDLHCDVPCHIFPPGARRDDTGVLLPKMLALAGHPDRAWAETPEIFRDSLGTLKAYLCIPTVLALRVWRAGKRRPFVARQRPVSDTVHRIAELLESGEAPHASELESIARNAPRGTMAVRCSFMLTTELLCVLRGLPNLSRAIRRAIISNASLQAKHYDGTRACVTVRLQHEAWLLVQDHSASSDYVENCCRHAYF